MSKSQIDALYCQTMLEQGFNKPESVFSVHRTQEGDEFLICQMDDDHLVNMVFYALQKAIEHNPVDQTSYPIADPLTELMTREQRIGMSTDNRRSFLFSLKILEPYILEVLIRQKSEDLPEDLRSIVEALQLVFDRKSGVPLPAQYAFTRIKEIRKARALGSVKVAESIQKETDL